ncbi:putative transcription factor C2H2 family [Medicago truncatula]|uniref:RING-type E3 ubiquitin transferase n=1 Tax=Medicago truncatula TaxID=3880 RepID=A0A072VL50_MEDTR|nr:RING-H2 finger protein ATL16 [Medicago truncatula]KEH42557.1 RING-H2 zinc finger protein [Medicago truncatula]RHN80063.1 putative transcription factor C2H2 family [Medicago truncatula]
MAMNKNQFYKLGYQALPPIITQDNTFYPHPPQPVSDYAFPIFAIVVLSIMATILLLLSYFTFLTKCCSNWNQVNPTRWISVLRVRQNEEDHFIALSPTLWNRGLDESVIREIPSFQFIKGECEDQSVYGCVVCLTEFQEQDVIKILPNCNHAFHLDCIDIWLQTNSNCPLCRSSISGNTTNTQFDIIIAPSSSPQDSQLLSNLGSDEDYVVIELGGGENEVEQERNESRGSIEHSRNYHSTRKMKPKKCHHVSIMGDECINIIRKKDETFSIQPIRRSFSMDSANDRQVFMDVQAIMQQNRHHQNEASASEDCNSRSRRQFFPFCYYGKGSKNAVLPFGE